MVNHPNRSKREREARGRSFVCRGCGVPVYRAAPIPTIAPGYCIACSIIESEPDPAAREAMRRLLRAERDPADSMPAAPGGMRLYVLDGQRRPVAATLEQFGAFMDSEARIVGRDRIGEAEVSTVFFGARPGGTRGAPNLFETLVSGGPHDGILVRYRTWDHARLGHAAVVARLGRPPLPDPEGSP